MVYSARDPASGGKEADGMLTVNEYCRRTFGEKLYKLSLNGGMTCPNRDGTCGTRGCVFCSAGGSGDFTPDASLPLSRQIEEAKARVAGKFGGGRFIAYFQAYTNTYAPVEKLRRMFLEVIERPDIAVLSVATRPDCVGDEVMELLKELREIKPVWVELGLQTVKPETVRYIRRGYATEVYDGAVERLNAAGIHTVTHVILGLPGETREDMLETVRHAVRCGTGGVKLQLLHVLEGTDLADDYRAGRFRTLTPEEYVSILRDCVALLPGDTVVHRLTGDGPKKILIAPLWSGDKKTVINMINRELGLNRRQDD